MEDKIRDRLMSELDGVESSQEAVAWAEALRSFEIAVSVKADRELRRSLPAG